MRWTALTDATLPLLVAVSLAACGDNAGNEGNEGNASDAAPLAPDAPARGEVTVNVAEFAPSLGTDVLLYDTDGLLLEHAKTDASGMVVFEDSPANSIVASLREWEGRRYVTVVEGVNPGDELHLNTFMKTTDVAGFVALDMPTPGGELGYANRVFDCTGVFRSDIANQLVLELSQRCSNGSGQASILLQATGSGGPFDLVGFSAATDLPLFATDTEAVANSITIPAFAKKVPVQVDVLNRFGDEQIAVSPFRSGIRYASAYASVDTVPATGPVSVALPAPAIGDSHKFVATHTAVGGALTNIQSVHQSVAGVPSAPVELDMSGAVGPLSDVTVSDARRQVTWTVDGGVSADYVAVGLTSGDVTWRHTLPAGRGQVQFPDLPAELAAFEPAGAGTGIVVVSRSSGDYAEFRQRPELIPSRFPGSFAATTSRLPLE